ncbi:MAG TPA: hypothetical protein DCL49_11735, partial [Candidatus Omnitrophica bacterium]|nr:hypothetical protein [Candidatus Omnitrophota bacterium]
EKYLRRYRLPEAPSQAVASSLEMPVNAMLSKERQRRIFGAAVNTRTNSVLSSPITMEKGLLCAKSGYVQPSGSALVKRLELKVFTPSSLYANEISLRPPGVSSSINNKGPPGLTFSLLTGPALRQVKAFALRGAIASPAVLNTVNVLYLAGLYVGIFFISFALFFSRRLMKSVLAQESDLTKNINANAKMLNQCKMIKYLSSRTLENNKERIRNSIEEIKSLQREVYIADQKEEGWNEEIHEPSLLSEKSLNPEIIAEPNLARMLKDKDPWHVRILPEAVFISGLVVLFFLFNLLWSSLNSVCSMGYAISLLFPAGLLSWGRFVLGSWLAKKLDDGPSVKSDADKNSDNLTDREKENDETSDFSSSPLREVQNRDSGHLSGSPLKKNDDFILLIGYASQHIIRSCAQKYYLSQRRPGNNGAAVTISSSVQEQEFVCARHAPGDSINCAQQRAIREYLANGYNNGTINAYTFPAAILAGVREIILNSSAYMKEPLLALLEGRSGLDLDIAGNKKMAGIELVVVDLGGQRGFQKEYGRPLVSLPITAKDGSGNFILRILLTRAFIEANIFRPAVIAQAVAYVLLRHIGLTHLEAVLEESGFNSEKTSHSLLSDLSRWCIVEDALIDRDFDYLFSLLSPWDELNSGSLLALKKKGSKDIPGVIVSAGLLSYEVANNAAVAILASAEQKEIAWLEKALARGCYTGDFLSLSDREEIFDTVFRLQETSRKLLSLGTIFTGFGPANAGDDIFMVPVILNMLTQELNIDFRRAVYAILYSYAVSVQEVSHYWGIHRQVVDSFFLDYSRISGFKKEVICCSLKAAAYSQDKDIKAIAGRFVSILGRQGKYREKGDAPIFAGSPLEREEKRPLSLSSLYKTGRLDSENIYMGGDVYIFWLFPIPENDFTYLRRNRIGSIPEIKGKDVLILGSGAGTYGFRAVLEGARVTMVEGDYNSLEFAKKASYYLYDKVIQESLGLQLPQLNYERLKEIELTNTTKQSIENLMFINKDVTMPLQFGDNSFDIVSIPFLLGVKNGVIQREEQVAVFRQTVRATRPGGRILIAPLPSEEIRKEIEEVIKPGEFDSSWIGLRETLEKMRKIGDKEVVLIERHGTIYNWCAEFEVSSSKGAASPMLLLVEENWDGSIYGGSPLGEEEKQPQNQRREENRTVPNFSNHPAEDFFATFEGPAYYPASEL